LTLLEETPDPALSSFKHLIDLLPIDQRHYWIGTLYTLLLPPKVRREQAAYFTPPLLADAVLAGCGKTRIGIHSGAVSR
jgi:adenine-specific DNA-methyltransferase